MLHSFTRNYNDLSTEAGFQFEFYCDCCGNGVQSTFIPSTTYKKQQNSRSFGRLASAVGRMIGGAAGDIGYALERGSDAVGSRFEGRSPQWRKEYEAALEKGMTIAADHFAETELAICKGKRMALENVLDWLTVCVNTARKDLEKSHDPAGVLATTLNAMDAMRAVYEKKLASDVRLISKSVAEKA